MSWWDRVDFSEMKVSHKVLSFDEKYTVTLEVDPETLDLIMPIPSEIIQNTDWGLNDTLEWIDNKDGTFTLVKV